MPCGVSVNKGEPGSLYRSSQVRSNRIRGCEPGADGLTRDVRVRRFFHHHSETQGSPERAVELLPWVHTIFSNLKTWLRGTYHGVSKKHLDRYLQEFVYRFNRRRVEHALFEHVIRAAATASPLTYGQLTAEPIG